MADIDMIPRSYRESRRARRVLARYGAALGLLAACGAAGGMVLRRQVAAEMPRLQQLRAASEQARILGERIAGAQQRRDALARDARALAALRGAGDPQLVAAALDAALNDKVWLDKLVFTRVQELLHDPLPNPAPPGTVQAASGGAVQSWRLAGYVEISARAQDQAAMTAFLGALAASPRLSDVRFLNSKVAEDGASTSFSVSAALRAPRESP